MTDQIRTEVELWLAVMCDRGILVDPGESTGEPSAVPAVKRTVAAIWHSYQDGLRLLARIGELEEREAAQKRQEMVR